MRLLTAFRCTSLITLPRSVISSFHCFSLLDAMLCPLLLAAAKPSYHKPRESYCYNLAILPTAEYSGKALTNCWWFLLFFSLLALSSSNCSTAACETSASFCTAANRAADWTPYMCLLNGSTCCSNCL
eukprot:GHRR01023426.1.p1 GENE.GHRR01023426.1~~GHRR01023426.1.p1  ORF type:complete len:128 (-),score=15.46 GHRR01023426.1:518-901(-)